ncbi:MAG: hypothetical protein SGI90_00240 [Candidatus Eisenbacteria bacterium]|nr:hypothetical protein [Candidatus Eisenbacteria bacterium]
MNRSGNALALILVVLAVGLVDRGGAASAQESATAPDTISELFRTLPMPPLEPGLQWGWDPTAYEPMAHPVLEDFLWRRREIDKRNLPMLVRARLELELAFLGAAQRQGPTDLRRVSNADSMTSEARAVRARRSYARLLAGVPDNGEVLTDEGDLHRFLGYPDSALASYRKAAASSRVPARLHGRLVNAELERLLANPAASTERVFRDRLADGEHFFAAPAPADSQRAARFHLERGRFRIDRAILEVRADQALHPERWRSAGADSLFSLMARVVSPETRRAFQAAAESDTNLAEAHGLLGSIVTGQIFLPIAAEGLLMRHTVASRDSLAAGLWHLLVKRREQRAGDAAYAAANLNRCELLAPSRYPRTRAELARLALLLGDLDGAAGLWRSLMVRDPDDINDQATELYTVHALEAAAGLPSDLPIAGRMEAAILGAMTANSGAAGAVSAPMLSWLGICRGGLGRLDEAHRDLSRSAAIDSTQWRARLGLAVLALREMNAAVAEPHLQYVGRNFNRLDEPARGLYCGAVGLLYAARRDSAKAKSWLMEAIRFDPLSPLLRKAANQVAGTP